MAQKSVAKIISVTIMDLVTPKAGAKHELLFNELSSEAMDSSHTHWLKIWYYIGSTGNSPNILANCKVY